MLSRQDLEQFCSRYGIDGIDGIGGGYQITSAKSGEGVSQLLRILKDQIPWDRMTATVTTITFKRIKEYILALKARPDREGVLVQPPALREQLQATDPAWQFSDVEMMTAVKHLQNHGYVAVLRSSSGTESILLTPDLLVDLASSIVLQADKHPRDLGALIEADLLKGKYHLAELVGLARLEQQVLVDAAIALFVDHNICFRESLGADALLIFPGLIKQKRPLMEESETVEDMSYIVRGRVENVYPALVVLLGYTQTFTRVNQWQNQAQYELGNGEICGFRLIEEHEGEIELILSYNQVMPDYGRTMFQGLFEQFLYKRDVDVTPIPPVICPDDHRQQRVTVVKRMRENKTHIFCDECSAKVSLPSAGKPGLLESTGAGWLVQRQEALARLRSTYETYLVRIKSYRRDRAAPRCYLSHVPEQREWVAELARDLRKAGVVVLEDRTRIQDADTIIVVRTAAYEQARSRADQTLKEDLQLIQGRLGEPDARHGKTLQLLFEDNTSTARTHHPDGRSLTYFRDQTHYPVSLFDLVLILYSINFDHPAFKPLREGLYKEWRQRFGPFEERDSKTFRQYPLKIFISYSHEDEAFKDTLVKMLAGLQHRGIIDAWQDRRIEEGDEWRASIEDAINECGLALLLLSSDFLASRFIQDNELPRLLQRRKEQGLHIIPIIVRPCLWEAEPVLSDLQTLPKDAKAVITFREETGERDQVWTDICRIIERRAVGTASERQR